MTNIDWNIVPEGYDWATTSADGELCVFKDRPVIKDDEWTGEGLLYSDRLYFDENWHKSIQHRPLKSLKNNNGNTKIVETKLGPLPNKLWVGMKAIFEDNKVYTLGGIDNEGIGCIIWVDKITIPLNVRCFTYKDGKRIYSNDNQVVLWEQPQTEEIDWKQKYEELSEKYNKLIEKNENLEFERIQLKTELSYTYKAREKLNKIVNLLNEG